MKVLARIAALPVFAVLLAGCAAGESGVAAADGFCQRVLARVASFFATAPPAPAKPEYGGTVVVGAYGELPDGLNGLVSSDANSRQFQQFVNLTTLIQYDADLKAAPYLARAWEVSEDQKELTFYLRNDVYWHDGTLTTAYDVEFTYLRATDPATAFPNAAFWDHYVKGQAGVTVVDSFTVKLRLEPHADVLDPWVVTPIMPRHLLEDVPPAELKQHPFGTRCPVGNGPFRFVEHRQDESWTFAANPFLPAGLGGRPYLDRVVWRVILEQTTLLTELLTGNVDMYIGLAPSQAKDIQESPIAELREFANRQYVFLGWNGRRPQLSDARVRRALTLGTNRKAIIDAVIRGYGQVANTTVPPFHWAHDTSLDDALPYDPEAAARLLDQAAWIDRNGDGIRENADGVPLRFTIKSNRGNQQRADIGELIQADLAKLGVQVDLQIVEYATLLSQINTPEVRDFDGVMMGWVTEFKVDDRDLFHSSAADDPYGWAGLADPRVDRLVEELPLIVDRNAALPRWHEYQYLISELQPYMFLYYPRRLIGVNRRLRDVILDVRGDWVSVQKWWIPPEMRRGQVAAR